jgi:hypothetical protein
MSQHLEALTEYFLANNPNLDRDLAAITVNRASKSPASTLNYLTSCASPEQLPESAPDNVQTLVRAMHQIGARIPRQPTCPRCHLERRVAHRLGDGTRGCSRCLAQEHTRKCSSCGGWKHIYRVVNGVDLCRPCTTPPAVRTCVRCGKSGTVFRNLHGRKICFSCEPPAPRRCSNCGTYKRVASRMVGGFVCHSCYHKIRRNGRECPDCRKVRILAYSSASGEAICAGCAKVPARYGCRSCGSESDYLGGECATCRNKAILDATLGSPPRDEALGNLRSVLLNMQPLALHKWLTRSPARDNFIAVVSMPPPRTTALLAAAPRGYATAHLRELLLMTGVITGKSDIWLEMYDRAVDDLLVGLRKEHRVMISTYSSWTVKPKLVRSAARRPIESPHYQNARRQIAGAVQFLRWLDERKVELRDLNQSLVDEFTITNPHQGWLRNFLRAIGKVYGLSFDLPSPPKQLHFPKVSDDRRVEVARSVLADPKVPHDVKTAALLVITFGVNILTSISLRRDSVRFLGPGAVWITINHRETLVPPWLGRLIWEQVERTSGEWVFPGSIPGAHIATHTLRRYFSPYGMTLRDLQVAARFQLALSMNPVMLANTIGLTPATILTYRNLSGGSWSDAPIAFGKLLPAR